jgi:S1-C subfamily serine protease
MKRILFLLLLLSLISCNNIIEPERPEAIFEKYKSSVVLIANQYYYEVTIDGYMYYYSPSSAQKIFTTKEAVLQNLSSSTGTGFIISANGEIITNNHVVNPKDENYKEEFFKFAENEKITIIDNISRYNDTIEVIINQYNELSSYMDSSEKDIYKSNYNLMLSNKDIWLNYYETLNNIDLNSSTSKVVNHKLGVAFNDTEVTDLADLQECDVIKLSDNEYVDLALIQTKNKTFNTYPANIFNFNDNNPNVGANPEEFAERDILKPININDDVFMIGYNKGFFLANTQLGIKAQFTSGKISQECDGVRILYTIPTLPGSSGSPVVDKWGNLIGVNFAGLTGSQSFNFAVPVAVLKNFYEQ